jgi:hypothetical protein
MAAAFFWVVVVVVVVVVQIRKDWALELHATANMGPARVGSRAG